MVGAFKSRHARSWKQKLDLISFNFFLFPAFFCFFSNYFHFPLLLSFRPLVTMLLSVRRGRYLRFAHNGPPLSCFTLSHLHSIVLLAVLSNTF